MKAEIDGYLAKNKLPQWDNTKIEVCLHIGENPEHKFSTKRDGSLAPRPARLRKVRDDVSRGARCRSPFPS